MPLLAKTYLTDVVMPMAVVAMAILAIICAVGLVRSVLRASSQRDAP